MSAIDQHAGAGRVVALARARRHSARVRRLRLALPVLALVLALVAILPGAGKLTTYGPVTVERITMEDGALKIERPRMSGFTGNHKAYEVRAETARQDIGKPHLVRLSGVSADIEEDGGGTTRLTATQGLFNTRDESLQLRRNIVVRWAAGHEMRLNSLRIVMKAGTVTSDEPVEIELANGRLRADRMRVENRGERIIFSGNAALDFRPDGQSVAPGGAGIGGNGEGRNDGDGDDGDPAR